MILHKCVHCSKKYVCQLDDCPYENDEFVGFCSRNCKEEYRKWPLFIFQGINSVQPVKNLKKLMKLDVINVTKDFEVNQKITGVLNIEKLFS